MSSNMITQTHKHIDEKWDIECDKDSILLNTMDPSPLQIDDEDVNMIDFDKLFATIDRLTSGPLCLNIFVKLLSDVQINNKLDTSSFGRFLTRILKKHKYSIKNRYSRITVHGYVVSSNGIKESTVFSSKLLKTTMEEHMKILWLNNEYSSVSTTEKLYINLVCVNIMNEMPTFCDTDPGIFGNIQTNFVDE